MEITSTDSVTKSVITSALNRRKIRVISKLVFKGRSFEFRCLKYSTVMIHEFASKNDRHICR